MKVAIALWLAVFAHVGRSANILIHKILENDKNERQINSSNNVTNQGLNQIEPVLRTGCNVDADRNCSLQDAENRKCVCIEGFIKYEDGRCRRCDCSFPGGYSPEIHNFFVHNGKCEACDCGDSGQSIGCEFRNGMKICNCSVNQAQVGGKCVECDCSDSGQSVGCVFQNGEKICNCPENRIQKDNKCVDCECGSSGQSVGCEYREGMKICHCFENQAHNLDKCIECDCGTNGECSFNTVGEKTCACDEIFLNKDGTCKECDCGVHGECSFNTDGLKMCTCPENQVEKDGKCVETACDQQPDFCAFNATCEQYDGHFFCTCPRGLTGDKCEVIADCERDGKYSDCMYGQGKCTFVAGKSICVCDNNKEFDISTKLCRETCDQQNSMCAFGSACEEIGDFSFCICPSGLLGDHCNIITDCEPAGKYSECVNGNGACTFDQERAVCYCGGVKEFDINTKTCRGTCDESDRKCFFDSKCKAQDDHSFCTCPPGLTGDRCEVVTDCESGGRYMGCEGGKGKCVFVNGNAVCDCGSGKEFDEHTRLCRATCEPAYVLCEHGSTCEKQSSYHFCTCPEGLSGARCEFITECETGKYQGCERNGGFCEFVKGEAVCFCRHDKKVFDVAKGICIECDCGAGGICSFNENGRKECTCQEKYVDRQGICEECDCGHGGKCSFNEDGDKVCICQEKYADKQGICAECDCGHGGICSFSEDEDKVCICQEKYAHKQGICAECDCGHGGKCSFNEDGRKQCICQGKYADKQGICTECNCGPNGKCRFLWDLKECECDIGYGNKNGFCSEIQSSTEISSTFPAIVTQPNCDCGVKSVDCKFDSSGRKRCFCLPGFSQKGNTCSETCNSDADCFNGGTCEKMDDAFFCACPENYAGDRCQVNAACDTLRMRCDAKRAVCRLTRDGAVCECPPDKAYRWFSGICENICDSRKCLNGKCEITGRSFNCVCDDGFSGFRCDEKITKKEGLPASIIGSALLAMAILFSTFVTLCLVCVIRRFTKVNGMKGDIE